MGVAASQAGRQERLAELSGASWTLAAVAAAELLTPHGYADVRLLPRMTSGLVPTVAQRP